LENSNGNSKKATTVLTVAKATIQTPFTMTTTTVNATASRKTARAAIVIMPKQSQQ
jgi:hypothetical protein